MNSQLNIWCRRGDSFCIELKIRYFNTRFLNHKLKKGGPIENVEKS